MNKIEFIQECCKYAKGFEVSIMGNEEIGYVTTIDIEKLVSFGMGAILEDGDLESYNYWIKIYYPLLLQRTIEGINKSTQSFRVIKIIQRADRLLIVDEADYCEYEVIGNNTNQAKEKALKWVLGTFKDRGEK